MKKDGWYEERAGTGVASIGDAILAPANSRGRVWAISHYSTTAAVSTSILRNGTTAGGTAIYRSDGPAVVGDGVSTSFPRGLYFDSGLFIDMTAGVPIVSVCFTLDGRSDS